MVSSRKRTREYESTAKKKVQLDKRQFTVLIVVYYLYDDSNEARPIRQVRRNQEVIISLVDENDSKFNFNVSSFELFIDQPKRR